MIVFSDAQTATVSSRTGFATEKKTVPTAPMNSPEPRPTATQLRLCVPEICGRYEKCLCAESDSSICLFARCFFVYTKSSKYREDVMQSDKLPGGGECPRQVCTYPLSVSFSPAPLRRAFRQWLDWWWLWPDYSAALKSAFRQDGAAIRRSTARITRTRRTAQSSSISASSTQYVDHLL